MDATQLHTPRYHSLLKWAFWASIIMFALYFWIDYSSYQDYLVDSNAERVSYRSRVAFQFFSLTFWGLIGLSINRLKEGLIAFGLAFVLVSLPSYFILDRNSDLRFLFIFLKFVPAFVFGMLIFKDERKWQVLWLVLILAGVSLMNYSYEILDSFGRIFRRTPIYDLFIYKMYGPDETGYREFHTLRRLLQAFKLFVATAAGMWFLDRLNRGIRPVFRSLDLRVNYSKLSSTAVFIFTKWIVFLGGISLSMVAVQRGYLPKSNIIMDANFVLQGAENILGLFAIAAFFRCFLAEYLLSKGYKVGWHFFWLMVPIVGELVWLISLISDRSIDNLSSRISHHKKAVFDYPEGLRTFLYVMAFLSVALSVGQAYRFGGEAMVTTLIVGVIALVLMIVYFSSPKMIYWILGLSFLSFVFMLFFGEELRGTKADFGNRLTSISNAIVFMVIFHLKAFKVYPFVEESELSDDALLNELRED